MVVIDLNCRRLNVGCVQAQDQLGQKCVGSGQPAAAFSGQRIACMVEAMNRGYLGKGWRPSKKESWGNNTD